MASAKVPIGLTDATPGVISTSSSSSRPRGKIEVSTSSPGTTSAIQALAASRAFCPTPPRATIIASPIVSAPTVSAARLRSRNSDARASRSSNRTNSANGDPAIRAIAGRMNGTTRATKSRTPYTRRARTTAVSSAPRGRMSRPATPTSANTAMSQRSRARRAVGRSRRALSASTGEMRPARRAGSIAAASVTTMPIASAARASLTVTTGAPSATEPTVRTQAAMPAASTAPSATPSSDPTMPMAVAWTRM